MTNYNEVEVMEKYEGITLSPSSAITYTRCPREFWFSYVMRIKTPPSIHLVKGTVVHKVLEDFFKKFEDNFQDRSEKIFLALWASKDIQDDLEELKLEPEVLEREKQDCMNMIHLYIMGLELKFNYLIFAEKAQNKRHAFYLLKPKMKEKYYRDEELNLHGYVDRIHTDFKSEVTIGDYKTSKRYGIGIKDEYELQSAIYALLYERCEKKRADWTSIIFLRYGEEVRTRVTPSQIRVALDTVKTINAAVVSNKKCDYPMREGKFCTWCNWFPYCAGLKEAEDEIQEKKVIAKIQEQKKLP